MVKRTLHKRAGLWELSIPLRAPVRGIWRFLTFEEAWGFLWRAGYPPGLPVEIKLAPGNGEPPQPGVEYLPDIDDVKGLLEEVTLPANEPKPARRPLPNSLLIAAGLVCALAILLMIFWGRLSDRGSPARSASVGSTLPASGAATPKPADDPVPPPVSGAAKSHASIETNDRSWVTACVDGGLVFSKLFTAGSQEDLEFVDRAVVRMGNAGPVKITLDGKSLGSLGQIGQVRVIELVRGAPHFLAGGEADDCTLFKSK